MPLQAGPVTVQSVFAYLCFKMPWNAALQLLIAAHMVDAGRDDTPRPLAAGRRRRQSDTHADQEEQMPAMSPGPGQAAGAPGAEAWPPGSQLACRRRFPGDARQIREVRRWVAALLPRCAARDDVLLVAAELGANAVQHTASGRGGWFTVEITQGGRAVRVAVTDSGAPQGPQLTADPLAETGRGLLVVRSLASHSGASGDHRGRRVWAVIPWIPGTPATAPGDAASADPGSRPQPAARQPAVPVPFGQLRAGGVSRVSQAAGDSTAGTSAGSPRPAQ
jgi:anti-sigma regulatory factor (Ser/Thr protein kinase)